jgi:hypothetical protein
MLGEPGDTQVVERPDSKAPIERQFDRWALSTSTNPIGSSSTTSETDPEMCTQPHELSSDSATAHGSADLRSRRQYRTPRQNDAWTTGQHAQNGTYAPASSTHIR